MKRNGGVERLHNVYDDVYDNQSQQERKQEFTRITLQIRQQEPKKIVINAVHPLIAAVDSDGSVHRRR